MKEKRKPFFKKIKKAITDRCIFLIISLLFSLNVFAQTQKSISGTVVDATGEPAIGASVTEKGTSRGTVTDVDGNFELSVGENAVLVVSYIGHTPQEIPVGNQTNFKIVLKENTQQLDEVVVIGYGTVKRADLTGSVTAVNADLKGRGLAPNAQDLMVGRLAGVSVVSNGGSPTDGSTIRIRGGSSLSANNDPLIVVDGIPLGGGPGGVGNVLSVINPMDIETFTVLKDASATAIYGSRASNGVIIITTKRGAVGKTKIMYEGNVSFSQKRNQMPVLSGDEFRDFVKTTFKGLSNEDEVVGKLGAANTDWQNEIFRTAVNTEHNLSVYGSVDNAMPYRASFGYTDVNGILKTAGMERYTGSISISPVLWDKHLTINANARGMYIKNRFADRSSIGAAIAMDPTQPVYDPNSPFGGYWSWVGNDGNLLKVATKNPVAMLEMNNDRSSGYQFIGNAQFDYKVHFLPELHLNLNLGLDYSNTTGSVIRPIDSPVQNQEYAFQKDWKNVRSNPLLDFYAQYKKEFGIHSLDAMAGYSWQRFWHKEPYTEQHIGAYLADGTPWVTNGDAPTELYLISFFGRVNYTLLNRYLFTVTMRTDGSSRFLPSHRWGLFPAAAFAWRINDESFLKNVKAISNLKLRLGWGITGQQDINQGDYPALSQYQTSQGLAANYYRDGQWVSLIKPLSYTPTLTWEKTTTYNAGLDYGFINNRISGSVDVYHRKTTDLINAEVKTAAGTNFSEYIVANVGSLENNGIEYTLNLVPVATKDIRWEVGFNMAYNKNKITELTYGDNSVAFRQFESTGGPGGRPLKIHKVGYAAGMFYVYQQIYDTNGTPVEGMYVDRNNDGQLNEQDLYIFHNSTPPFIFGFNTRLTWKSWDISMASHGNIGNYVYNGMASNNAELSPARVYANEFLSNRLKSAFDVNFQMKQVLSDYYIQNASFYRIDNITLGWSFTKNKHFPLSGRIYGSVQDPFVFTKYTGLDPEISNGIDNNFYPRPVTVLFGVNVNF